MTEIDKALELFQQDMEDPEKQSQFYDLFLNSLFFIPVSLPPEGEAEGDDDAEAMPLVITAEEKDYLVLFDSEERLFAWAETEAEHIKVPGHIIAQFSTPDLYWAMNVGCDLSKEFVPEEIAWLKDVVERFNADQEEEEPQG